MKTTKLLAIMILALCLLFCLAKVSDAAPLGTAFTYQGRLNDDDSPADGVYEMEFKLFGSATDPNELGTFSPGSVDVADGYFTVELDFGSNVFNGEARWLEISVGSDEIAGPLTTLSPRQEITPTPYALQTRGIFVSDALDVGIGTQSPAGKLHVDGGKAFSGTWGADIMIKAQDGGDGWAMQPDGMAGGDIILMPGEGGDEMREGSPGPGGNVGIGTITPTTKLDVVGTVTATAFVGDGSDLTGIAGESGWIISGDDMYSLPSGNVGIGISSPAYPLHVKKNSANTWIAGLHNLGTEPQDYGLVVRADGGDPLLVQAGSLNALNVKQSGNIGIGTTNPTSKLHVNGEIKASNMPGCEYSDFPDYSLVFGVWNNVGSISLTLPEGGYIIVTFTGTVFIHDPGIATIALGVTPTDTSHVTRCSSNNASHQYIPFCIQYTSYFNGVGTATFYGLATASIGGASLEDMQMTAIYVPVRY